MIRTNKSNKRETWAAGVSLALGLLVAGAIKAGFAFSASEPSVVQPKRSVSTAVRVRARPVPLVEKPTQPQPPQPVAVRKPVAAPAPLPIQTEAAPTASKSPPAVAAAVIEQAPSIALTQPERVLPTTDAAEVPPIPEMPTLPVSPVVAVLGLEEAPAAPPDDYVPPEPTYPEKPGGEVLVLGVLVNELGQVVDTKILVPSHNGLGDLSYAMVARNERITDVTPALKPGETRWLEVRVRFPLQQQILP